MKNIKKQLEEIHERIGKDRFEKAVFDLIDSYCALEYQKFGLGGLLESCTKGMTERLLNGLKTDD